MWTFRFPALAVGGDRKDKLLAVGVGVFALITLVLAAWTVIGPESPRERDVLYHRCADPACAYGWTLTVKEASAKFAEIPDRTLRALSASELTCPQCQREGYSSARGYRCPKCKDFSVSNVSLARTRRRLGIRAPVPRGPVICEHCGVDVVAWWREHRRQLYAAAHQ